MNDNLENRNGFLTAKEVDLIRQLTQARLDQKSELEYESFEGYEVPPATQFSMLKKPTVSIKYGQMKFNMAAIRLFEGIEHIIPILNPHKKTLAIIMCSEEETSSVPWARLKKGRWENKDITAPDVIESYFKLMGWDRKAKYKLIGRVKNSDRGLILRFDLEEALIIGTDEYIDKKTGETKKRQIKYYPDQYKDRYGKSYNDYMKLNQLSMFESLEGYIMEQTPPQETPAVEEPKTITEEGGQENEATDFVLRQEEQHDNWSGGGQSSWMP